MSGYPKVMIIAGEASGDLHGSRLVQAMRKRAPSLRFLGMGGSELAGAGVELLCDAARVSVVGLTEVFTHLGAILAARRTLVRAMQRERPALLILIDFPDFNLWLARTAKKLSIPVFYYISPQIWAWRRGRARTIGRLADRIGVILPFEEEVYRKYGIRADFVGHPLMDTVRAEMEEEEFRDRYALGSRLLIGLLPGSRSREVRALLPLFVDAAALLRHRLSAPCTFLVPRAPTVSRQQLMAAGLENSREEIDLRIIDQDRYALMHACRAAVAASGTVTLELAILGTPTVTGYRVSPLTYRLGRLLVRDLDHFSLVNLIAGREVIPELLQDDLTPQAIADALLPLLTDTPARKGMLAGLERVRHLLGDAGASERAAELALSLL